MKMGCMERRPLNP